MKTNCDASFANLFGQYHFDPESNLADVHSQRARRKVDVQTVCGTGYRIGEAQ